MDCSSVHTSETVVGERCAKTPTSLVSMSSEEKPANSGAKPVEDMSPEEIARREAKKKAKEEEKAAKAAKIAEKQAKMEAEKAAAATKAAAPVKEAEAAKAVAVIEEDTTPHGEKKDMSKPMNDAYHPKSVEAAWGAWWEKTGINSANAHTANPKRFVMVIPPPNVTGTLHLGHALTCAIEDCITRYHRMKGYETLWVPGTDHAGIATQVIVEKKLQREQGKSRHDFGREAFLQEVWKWKEDHGNTICKQLRRLGASVDWSREAFTMDAKLSVAVTEAFCRLFGDGLIYRANRLVNWSCALRTAISDIEVEHIDLTGPKKLKVPGHEKMVEFGVLHSFAYKVVKQSADEPDAELVVSTTRLETMLGDVAVAVHPEDPRYTQFHSRLLEHPFIPGRQLRVVCDSELVDMAFGTGAVKITPAHDPNDFKCGQRHNLQFINILDDDGKINRNGGKFAGMPRYDVRWALVQELTAMGLFRGTTPNPMRLGLDSRSKDVVEPIIRPQWFCRCKGMADKAVEAVRCGELELLPAGMHESTWNYWMENIQDWCVSRQLWWGHQIPAYLVTVDGETPDGYSTEQWVIGRTEAEAMANAQAKYPGKNISLQRDPDVLDTWFSSGLFPFSVFGWPNDTPDLRAFYPTTLLETGHDIMFFWVARMVMMGQQLTGQLPFKKVYLHAMVRDKYGRKMSKSLGNVLDPIHVMEGITLAQLNQTLRSGNLDPSEVEKAVKGQELDFPKGIPECGADALRFGLLAYTSQGRDINLDIQRVVAYRQFCNKLWNATRFALPNFASLSADEAAVMAKQDTSVLGRAEGHESFADRWILHQLHYTCGALEKAFAAYDFSAGTTLVNDFWWDICDYYLELIKPVMRLDESDPKRKAATAVLYTCLDHGLRIMHPFMPFVTEELYQRLPGRQAADSVASSAFPVAPEHWCNQEVAARFALFKDLVHATRSAKVGLGLESNARPQVAVMCASETDVASLSALESDMATLAKCASFKVLHATDAAPQGAAMSPVVSRPGTTLYVVLSGLVDFAVEIAKLRKSQVKLEETVVTHRKKMAIPGWAEKTPEDIRTQTLDKLKEYEEQIEKLKVSIETYTQLVAAAPQK